MRLQKNLYNVKEIKLSQEAKFENSILYVNAEELKNLLMEDKRFSDVEVHVAKPGDSVRIVQIADIIQPQAKVSEKYPNFPGALDKPGIIGEGETAVLNNMAVVVCSEAINYRRGGPYSPGKTFDLVGPEAKMSIFGKLNHVIIYPKKAPETSVPKYQVALKVAGLKTAVYLAKLAKNLKPDDTEVFDLPDLCTASRAVKNLPKVGYIMQIKMNQMDEFPGEPILYGDTIHHMLPTILHPNEILDGAIVNAIIGNLNDTYTIQNHPVIKELYKRHGKELNFAGVIVTISHSIAEERARAAVMNATLAKNVLGVDGVIVTKSGGGAPEIDMSETALACENLGIKTSILMWQMMTIDDGGNLFNNPKLDAITATGIFNGVVPVPPVEKVIGPTGIVRGGVPVSDKHFQLKWDILGVTDQMGISHMQSIDY